MIRRSFKMWFFAILTLGVLSFVAGGIIAYTTERDVVATVTDKDRVCSGSDSEGRTSCRYLIFTDETTYENTDSMWFLKWNSSDLYGRIRENGTYRFTITGFRVPFLTWYPNIVKVEPVESV